MAGGAETPNIAALPAIVLIGAGSGRRSAREAIDLSNDGGVTLGRLFTSTGELLNWLSPFARLANYAHKSICGSQRNLTVAALGLSDGSIAVETKAEARNTQASLSVGVGHA